MHCYPLNAPPPTPLPHANPPLSDKLAHWETRKRALNREGEHGTLALHEPTSTLPPAPGRPPSFCPHKTTQHTAGRRRRTLYKEVTMIPLPLMERSPRHTNWSFWELVSTTALLTWMHIGKLLLSMRLAVLTVSPRKQ